MNVNELKNVIVRLDSINAELVDLLNDLPSPVSPTAEMREAGMCFRRARGYLMDDLGRQLALDEMGQP